MQVVTYQSPAGQKLHICEPCQEQLHRVDEWPRDARGQEYCQVSHGLHRGQCDLCG